MASPTLTQWQISSAAKVANIWNGQQALADEGNYFLATNPTVGTGIAMTTSVVDDAATASSTHAQFSPTMLVQNNWPVTDALQHRIYLQYLRVSVITQAPTSASDWRFAFRGDNVTSRYTSGGSVIVPVNVNMDSNNASNAKIYFGAVVSALPSATGGRLLSKGIVDYALPIIGDQWLFTFGDVSMPSYQIAATALKQITIPCGPIIIGPQQNVTFEQWGTSNAAAPAFEFELGYVERAAGL